MSLDKSVQDLIKATDHQTEISQELAQEVAGKMQAIDAKADTAISRVESNFNAKVKDLTDYAIVGHKKAIEDASGGKNTILVVCTRQS